MTTQLIGAKRLKPLRGILTILLILLFVFGLNALLQMCVNAGLISFTVGSVLFWILSFGLGVFIFVRFSLVTMYQADGVKLIISRIYIKNPRFCEQLLLREIVFIGSREAAEKKYKISFKKHYEGFGKESVTALVVKRGGLYTEFILRPDENMLAALKGKPQSGANN